MKKLVLFPLALLSITCCNSKKTIASKESSEKMKIENTCPENVNCTFEILQNKSLDVKTDGIGKIYYELAENPDKVVFLYKYDLIVGDETLQDAGYTEEIIFEMDKNYSDFSVSGKGLQSTKMLFGVSCFCRGKAGHYKVTDGSISIKESQLLINIPAIVNDQKTTTVKIKL